MTVFHTPVISASKQSKEDKQHGINRMLDNFHGPIDHVDDLAGNHGATRPMHSSGNFDFANIRVLPKLKVSRPGDPYEQEADRIAEQIMRTPASIADNRIMTDKQVRIDRKCTACEMDKRKEENDLKISRKTADSALDDSALTNEIRHVTSSQGSSLDGDTSQFMESRFGYDFGSVRIHSDDRAARSAKSIHALAYTVGNDIVFAEGQYQPNNQIGRRLLAHELAHVVQQNGAYGVAVQRTPDSEDEQREFVRMTAFFLNESAEYFGNERVTIDQALFERLINNWYLMVEDRERMIGSQLGDDALLRRELRAAYTAAIRVLMRRAARSLGRSERDLYRENTGRIPMWAWQTPHHMELGISTPIAEGRTADILTGEVNFTANGIQVTIAQDTTDPSLTGAETSINFAPGNINWVSHPQGGQQVITSFTGPGIPTARIQTKYGQGVSSSATSGYGRGTTPEDIAGGRINQRSTSLGFHEGQHGLDYVEFIENNAPPQFTGAVGMTTTQFSAAIAQWQAAWRAYNDRADDFSKGRTDCVGTMTIDQYNQAHAAPGATITLHCTP